MKLFSRVMSPSAGRLYPVGRRASQYRLALRLPIAWAKATCSGSQVSSVVERTLEQCTPSDRCTPEQLRQMKQPRFTDAHVGPLALQSAHRRLSSCLRRAVRMRLWLSFCAFVTALLPFMTAIVVRPCQCSWWWPRKAETLTIVAAPDCSAWTTGADADVYACGNAVLEVWRVHSYKLQPSGRREDCPILACLTCLGFATDSMSCCMSECQRD